jgi:hypothetical protein
MYAKINNGVIEKYPYSYGQLQADNPNTSFPSNPTEELLAGFNVVSVISTPHPSFDYTKNVVEGTPKFVNGAWKQTWVVTDNPDAARIAENLRLEAYRNEADPLFFKAQRGEATMQEWQDKVAEIKSRYPKD